MKFLNLLWLLCLCSAAFNSLAQSTQPAARSTSQSTEEYYATAPLAQVFPPEIINSNVIIVGSLVPISFGGL